MAVEEMLAFYAIFANLLVATRRCSILDASMAPFLQTATIKDVVCVSWAQIISSLLLVIREKTHPRGV